MIVYMPSLPPLPPPPPPPARLRNADKQVDHARANALQLARALQRRLAKLVHDLEDPGSSPWRVQRAVDAVWQLSAAQLKRSTDALKLYNLLVVFDLAVKKQDAFGSNVHFAFARLLDLAGLSHAARPDPRTLLAAIDLWGKRTTSKGQPSKWPLVAAVATSITGTERTAEAVKQFWCSFARHYEKHGLYRLWGPPLGPR